MNGPGQVVVTDLETERREIEIEPLEYLQSEESYSRRVEAYQIFEGSVAQYRCEYHLSQATFQGSHCYVTGHTATPKQTPTDARIALPRLIQFSFEWSLQNPPGCEARSRGSVAHGLPSSPSPEHLS
jgi:hypothetical protein